MGGGPAPSDLLISKDKLGELSKNPFGFVLAIALAPDHSFSVEEIAKLEGLSKVPNGTVFNRFVKGPIVIWTGEQLEDGSIWTGGKPMEAITIASNPYIMGGQPSFWPLPLQRQGVCSTVMWETTLPEEPSPTWMDYLCKTITKEWKGLFWTLSKK